MRLIKFGVTNVTGDATGTLWNVTVGVVYGDNDLLCDANVTPSTASHGCAAKAPAFTADSQVMSTVTAGHTLSCKSATGSQFCSVVVLNTVVKKRLADN
jgi:hypothetical protein